VQKSNNDSCNRITGLRRALAQALRRCRFEGTATVVINDQAIAVHFIAWRKCAPQ